MSPPPTTSSIAAAGEAAFELWGLPVAVLALIVSVLGFVAAGVSLIWQIVRWSRDGGRATVRLDHEVVVAAGSTISIESGKFSLPGMAARAKRAGSPMSLSYVELARVTVENPGRTAMSIIGPEMRLTGGSHRKHRATPPQVDKDDLFTTVPGSDPTRIEPFGVAVFHFDFRPGLRDEIARHPHLTMRAQVKVAGRRRPFKSSWRRRWRVGAAPDTFREDGRLDAETIIFRSLLYSLRSWDRDEKPSEWGLARMAKTLAARLEDKWEEVHPLLDEVRLVAEGTPAIGPLDTTACGLFLKRELERYGDRLAWPPQGGPESLLLSEMAAASRQRKGEMMIESSQKPGRSASPSPRDESE